MSFNINHNAEIIASTPKNFDHYVGFHDIKPFNIEKDNLMILHRLPLNALGFKGNKHSAEICLWDRARLIKNCHPRSILLLPLSKRDRIQLSLI